MEEISAAVRDVSGEDFRSISYEAQQLLKSVRASNGYSDGVDAAFYRAYFEGFSGKARSDSKILSNAALEAAYQMGVDAKNDVGTFHTVGNATISKEATAFLARAAKDLGLSITYGGKGSVANGGVVDGAVRRDVRRGYSNSYRGIHIYEDAKVQEVGGKTLVGGDAAARIILGHELTHVLQEESPEQYKAFENLVLSQTSEKSISIYMETLNKSREDAIDEIVADYAMTRMFSDMKTAREVTKHHSKVAEAIRRAFAWIREKLGIRTSEVDRAAAMWNKAYNESRRNASGAVDLAERMAGYHADRIAEAETNATVKDSRAIDNRPPKDYNAFDEALDRRQWAQLYAEVERRESEGQIEDGANYYFTESGTPKLAIFRYDASAKNKTEVVAAYKSSSALNDAIICLKEIYKNGSGSFVSEFHRLAESGELQQYDVRVRYYQYASASNRGTSGVSGQSSRIGTDGNAGERTSQNGVGHGSRVAGTNEITKKADSAESAFSIGKVKDSIAMPNTDSEGSTLTEAQQKFFSGSLVTDEDGALLPVYHATDSAEFTVFDKSKLGYNTDGNTSDEGMAATAHVGFWFNTKNLIGEAGSRAEKVYLNLTNPYELTSLDALAEEIKALGEGETPAEMGEAYATDLWLRGYDGIEIRHDEEFGGTSYVAFDENQIKRTTNKSPTKDADIRYSTSLSDYARIVSDRIDEAKRGRQTSVAEVLRRNEKEARDVKREFLPDMKTVGEVARFYLDRTMRSMLYCVRMTISENGGGSDERNATGAQSVCQQRHKQALLYL